MTRGAHFAVCMLIGATILGQQAFAQKAATEFIAMPDDVVCSVKQIGVQFTNNGQEPLVSLSCTYAGKAAKKIALKSEILSKGRLLTRQFGDFHISNFGGVDVATAMHAGAPSNDSKAGLSIEIATDKLKAFTDYLQK